MKPLAHHSKPLSKSWIAIPILISAPTEQTAEKLPRPTIYSQPLSRRSRNVNKLLRLKLKTMAMITDIVCEKLNDRSKVCSARLRVAR